MQSNTAKCKLLYKQLSCKQLSKTLLNQWISLGKKATIYQVTNMQATSKNVLFPGHNHHANHRYGWPNT